MGRGACGLLGCTARSIQHMMGHLGRTHTVLGNMDANALLMTISPVRMASGAELVRGLAHVEPERHGADLPRPHPPEGHRRHDRWDLRLRRYLDEPHSARPRPPGREQDGCTPPAAQSL